MCICMYVCMCVYIYIYISKRGWACSKCAPERAQAAPLTRGLDSVPCENSQKCTRNGI